MAVFWKLAPEPGRFLRRCGGRFTIATEAVDFRVAVSGSERDITYGTGAKGAPLRSRTWHCSVVGITARSTRRGIRSSGSPTAHSTFDAPTAALCLRLRRHRRYPTIQWRASARITV